MIWKLIEPYKGQDPIDFPTDFFYEGRGGEEGATSREEVINDDDIFSFFYGSFLYLDTDRKSVV